MAVNSTLLQNNPKVDPLHSLSKSLKKSLSSRVNSLGGVRNKVKYRWYRIIIHTLRSLGLSRLLLGAPYSIEEDASEAFNFSELYPAETVVLGDPRNDPFLRSCQDIPGGRFDRSRIFVCELASAKFSPENGLVFDSRWRNVVESIFDHRRWYTFRKTFRPRTLERRSGVFSSVQHPWHYNNWHWTVDSLPQIRSLALHMHGRPLTLLMSNDVNPVHREALACVLPENFTVEYVDPSQWFELETFVLPSYVSTRANAFFPPEYYEFIRANTFTRLGIARPASRTGRYYISRDRAQHRRLLNESETVSLLEQFGFTRIFIEDYDFRQQVELFRNAEAIVSPHGAALGGIVYGDDLKVCVLYPEARPAGYFYTLARGLGHQHVCVNSNLQEHDDFRVDLAALRRVLTDELHLRRIA